MKGGVGGVGGVGREVGGVWLGYACQGCYSTAMVYVCTGVLPAYGYNALNVQ